MLGLQLGLQSGVTFSEKWGYTFRVLGGRIEGEGKGMFYGVGWGKLPICDIGKMCHVLSKALCLWGFLYALILKRGGTPLQMGVLMVLEGYMYGVMAYHQ